MTTLRATTSRPGTGRLRRLAVVPALLLAVAALAGCGARAPSDPGGVEYAALGDSYSAGAGISPVADTGCLRSKADYPSLVQQQLHYSTFQDVTCSGAMTTNLLRPQLTDAATNDPQLDAVGSRTRLVTLTLGVNDDQLAYDLWAACLTPSGQPSALCRTILGASQSQLDQQLGDAATRVEESLRLIRKAAPKARIVLVGYPRIVPDSGNCPDRLPLAAAMVPQLRTAMETLDRKWKDAAARAGADYVDTWQMSRGHDVCSASPWVNGWTAQPGRAAALHPFEPFHQAVARQIVALAQR